ncbi:uncharacterized protein LOC106066799 [Biomphalaria glabrata]|uniref:Uncharacterized protein LOC106066799 n=1 Tax=Biomphalaria glabrata TaxID=6526 RepID=A0A9U8EC44_BIOGL|nr:uncharacterized protein LOC106066799 [Biomphalaria glabrata]XP_013081337.2 uncharacterized protein LOC106066799 [Biomphalaria glabrata]XP_055887939.1 uncharacterized protein LOC106066799 [Biomphalaria glabrata]
MARTSLSLILLLSSYSLAEVTLDTKCYSEARKSSTNRFYYRPGSQISCLCTSNNGTTVQWVTEHGQVLSNGTLNITVASNVTRYICQEINKIENNVTFTVHVLYVPTEATLTFNATSNVCSSSAVLVQCETPYVDYQQSPMISFFDISSADRVNLTNATPVNTRNGKWSSTSVYITASGGQRTILCRVSDSEFNDLYTDTQDVINVQEASKVYPIITIGANNYQNGETLDVQDSSQFSPKCQVSSVSSGYFRLELTCDSSNSTNIFSSNNDYGTSVYLATVSVTKYMIGKKCLCKATHSSGCYTLTTAVNINVLYAPEINYLKVNGNTTSVTVNRGDALNFICNATGNPLPSLYMTHEIPTSVPFQTVQSYTLDFTQQAGCSDTDLFYCVAKNTINTGTQTSKQRSVQVYVRCPPNVTSETNSYAITLGATSEFRIPIAAYPDPFKFVLYTTGVKFHKEVDLKRYNLTYVSTNPSQGKGNIVIHLYTTTSADLVDYILDINNGVDSNGISYSFKLTETEDGLSIGAKIGIGVGVAGAVVIIIIIVVVLCGRNKIKRSLKEKSKEKNPYDMTYQYVGPYNGGYMQPKDNQPDEGYVDVEEQYDTIPADYEGPVVVSCLAKPDDMASAESGVLSSRISNPNYIENFSGARDFPYGGSAYSQATEVSYPSTSIYSINTNSNMISNVETIQAAG